MVLSPSGALSAPRPDPLLPSCSLLRGAGHDTATTRADFQRKSPCASHNGSNSCKGNVSPGPSENRVCLF